MYTIEFSPEADDDLLKISMLGAKAQEKLNRLIQELKEHPTTGTGHPEPLRGSKTGRWSRRITQKHRLVYRIKEAEQTVLVLSAYGHYDDK
jgi:toxin YoeB